MSSNSLLRAVHTWRRLPNLFSRAKPNQQLWNSSSSYQHIHTKTILFDTYDSPVAATLLPGQPSSDEFYPVKRIPHFSEELYHALFMLKPDSPPNSRVLKIALLGCPNSGKSSLVNMLCYWRVCATSMRVNTTRSKQSAILTHDDAQLIFVDLPGVVARKKRLDHKLEKSIFRDPHAAIFDADLILVVVDINHKYSRYEIDKEVLRALYYFNDKPSILVLNKIDRLPRRRGALLDITRRLTDGIVGGFSSHIDKFANRLKQKAPELVQLEQDPRLKALEAKHSNSQLSLQQENPQDALLSGRWSDKPLALDDGRCFVPWPDPNLIKLNESSQWLDVDEKMALMQNSFKSLTSEHSSHTSKDPLPMKLSEPETSIELETNSASANQSLIHKGRDIQPEIAQSVDDYFKSEYTEDMENDSQLAEVNSTKVPQTADSVDEIIWKHLEETMLLKSVSKEVVRERRERWHEVRDLVRGQISWPHFQQVFMCSAATGEGVDNLRKHLLSLAKPGAWSFHSTIITETEPQEIVRMCIWAHCLNVLPNETPYRVGIRVDDYDKSPDETLFIRAVLLCCNERELKVVIGPGGETIRAIAAAAKDELRQSFQTELVLKLDAALATVPGPHLKTIKASKDMRECFPDLGK